MSKTKSYEEINQKLKAGKAVVLTAEEVAEMAKELTPEEIVEKVDVVTTATFGAMCSSGAIINFGHADPPIRMEKIRLNGVPCYEGLAAVDSYIGATACDPDNPEYGGAHVIQDLLEGKDVILEAWAKGTDCYPRKHIKTKININTVNEFTLFNPRNAYQNYNVAVNTTSWIKHTYMGTLLPNLRNATYSTSGELSPLLNDPEFKTIGLGTRIFLGGTQGFVVWPGTQFHTTKPKNELGVPVTNAATIAVMGNLKEMSPEYIQAASYEKYGVSMFVGIGIPIPVLNADIAKRVSINNSQIETSVLDYGTVGTPKLGQVTYEELQSGTIKVKGKKIRTAPVASLKKARKIADELKKWLLNGEFEVTKPVQMFPTNTSLNGLKETEVDND
ncbi:homocysteine biosynthesis protein [Draconibacterium sp. IB214405]|uniref:homocysteine biosynthesis protein n=1 Tax=Draconibacterium sp. IB214405 TaxID=3097352 RepID=UPI002A11FD0C|nr:homocysteine biosynthesis protein [Draconibacterium sp. IB214405]MDX8337566.1 homocysteine biosynthesis protein [Draconibacterium sp. IB214405]